MSWNDDRRLYTVVPMHGEQALPRAPSSGAACPASAGQSVPAPSAGPVSVFIAVPCYGQIEPGFVASLLDLQAALLRLGVRHEVYFLPGESHINRARNRLVQAFRKTDFSALLFLDADLIFTPTAVLRLLTSRHDVVAAPYAKKGEEQGLVGNVAPREGTERQTEDGRITGQVEDDGDGFVKARDVGTGCLLIHRSVFVQLADAKRDDGEHAMCAYTDDMGTGEQVLPFFDSGPEDGRDPKARYLTEDFWFCRLWQTLCGGAVWLDSRSTIQHVGRHAFTAPSLTRKWAKEAAR